MSLDNSVLKTVDWGKSPLLPAVAQDFFTGEVLMLAYMNKEALELSIETGLAHYYSRSREKLWKKGESSGHFQHIKEIYLDCDSDAVLIKIEQDGGVACHTGRKSCFYQKIDSNSCETICEPIKDISSYSIGDKVYHAILEKKHADPKESYVASLFHKGENAILKKVVEEAGEFCFAIKDGDKKEIVYEAADLAFHALVALGYRNINPDLISQELEKRFGTSGIAEKQSRNDH
ncbi:MAG: bifunctional phosphoribosyl-AMP cyclohydrolase/phosphoribosyl-ATP diphosphatase HisIE [Sulfurospirillaceae bacterium]|nr:bifunctional phosphoribosyl-AMP cyclohydrolase/phosphoribosyl-ATP diphosphatase HisIE [Sulfurospirillaceae bacterium]